MKRSDSPLNFYRRASVKTALVQRFGCELQNSSLTLLDKFDEIGKCWRG